MDAEFNKEESEKIINHIADLRKGLAEQMRVMEEAMVMPAGGEFLHETFIGYARAILMFGDMLMNVAEFLDTFLQGISTTARELADEDTQES